ncbi:uncharacterized protein LOC144421086 isoform X2 [Styela clava]
MDVKELLNHTYVFPALPSSNSTTNTIQGYSSIETAIGILCACITLSVVLVFLYKVVKKKQESMIADLSHRVHLSMTDTAYSGTETDSQRRECNNYSYITIPSKKNNKVAPCAMNKTQSSEQFTICSENQLGSMTKSAPQYGSLGERQIKRIRTSTTATGTPFDYKRYIDIDKYDVKDILHSAKIDMENLRQRISNRSKNAGRAKKCIEECNSMLNNAKGRVKELLSNRSREVKIWQKTKVRELGNEKKSMSRVRPIKWTADSNDVLISMQYWFQGLKLHPQLKEIAEDIVALQSLHRKQSEVEWRQISMLSDSISCISASQPILRRAKSQVKELEQANKAQLKKLTARIDCFDKNTTSNSSGVGKNSRKSFLLQPGKDTASDTTKLSIAHRSKATSYHKLKTSKSETRIKTTKLPNREIKRNADADRPSALPNQIKTHQMPNIEREIPIPIKNNPNRRIQIRNVEA